MRTLITPSRLIGGLLLVTTLGSAAADAPAQELLYSTEAIHVLAGSGHSWGFAALDPTRPYLFLARRENGLSVFDIERQVLVKQLDETQGANAVAFAPELNRAYVANMDGTLGILRLDDMTLLKRLPVDAGNLNNLLYDSERKRVLITSGRRAESSTLYLFDPAQERIVASHELPVRKLDAPLLLRSGELVLPLRDEDQVALLSGEALQHHRTWRFAACSKPSAVAADERHQRLFVACRGETPTLLVVDLATGNVLTTLPVDRAVNVMAFDEDLGRLLIPSGPDASLTVVERGTDGRYRARGSVGTRPWAHNMVYDAARGRVHLFTMDFTQPAPDEANAKPDPIFHADTFSILTLASPETPNR
ncbi:hypothetical protein L1F06_013240 [Ectopseudomonas hydrolytica]|uniref:Uncharacterized protein n=1 Tax=Ectopseudomonas hydrolytica TaxID=2493633 RepID=A0ABY5A1I3_9GAMM|nr:hypothetical protein [Pseudomonas hydrolytica]OCX15299.1 hypothetical protein BBI09_16075 [Stutzerimonas xanthomarina]USR37660.1 hypothetical protein L1F06_013240 [Pseudomonas hydrolytica]